LELSRNEYGKEEPVEENGSQRQGEIQMAITSDRVREIFKGLENGDGAAFFERVAEDVVWTVMGTHGGALKEA
jgi:hypothetical protein